MKGPESFGTETPSNKNEDERPSTEGLEVEEGEAVEDEKTAQELEELQKALDSTDVTEHGKAEVIEMKGHAPNAEEDDVDIAA